MAVESGDDNAAADVAAAAAAVVGYSRGFGYVTYYSYSDM